MITTIQVPPMLVLSGHRVWFVLETDNEDANYVEVTVKSNGGVLAYDRMYVNADGRGSIDISRYLDDALVPEPLADAGYYFFVNASMSKVFEVHFNDGGVDTVFVLTAIKGRMSRSLELRLRDEGYDGSFLSYLQESKRFLSFKEGEIDIYSGSQPERLYLPVVVTSADDLELRVRTILSDGSEENDAVVRVNWPTFGSVVELDSSYDTLMEHMGQYEVGLVKVVGYGISFGIEDGALITEEKVFRLAGSDDWTRTMFRYSNPAGGFDLLVALGERGRESSIDVAVIPRGSGPGVLRAYYETRGDGNEVEIVGSGGKGFAGTEELAAFLGSSKVWLVDGSGGFVPVKLLGGNLSRSISDMPMNLVEIKYLLDMGDRSDSGEGSLQISGTMSAYASGACPYWTPQTGIITFSNFGGGSGEYQFSVDGGLTWDEPLVQPGVWFGMEVAAGIAEHEPMMRDKLNTLNVRIFPKVVIPLKEEFSVDTLVVKSSTGEDNGRIIVSNPVFGGDTLFMSLWENTLSLLKTSGSNPVFPYTFGDLPPGTYALTLEDIALEGQGPEEANCSVTLADIVVGESDYLVPLSATIVYYNPSAYGVLDGQIFLSDPTGGSGTGYRYSINNGGIWQVSGNFEGLGPGTYYVKIKDDHISEALLEIVVLLGGALAVPGNVAGEQLIQCEGPVLSWDLVTDAIFYEWMRSSDSLETINRVYTNMVQDDEMAATYTDSVALKYKVRAGNATSFSAWSGEVTVVLVCGGGVEYLG